MKETAIGILFKNDQKEILVLKRRDIPIWVLPGGGIEANELPEEAVVREFQEETGLIVKVKRKIAFYSPINCLSNAVHVFELTQINGLPVVCNEAKAIGFFSIQNLPIPFFLLHKEWIKDALKYEKDVIYATLAVSFYKALRYALRHPILSIRYLLARVGLPLNI